MSLKTAMLMPATMELVARPWPGAPDWTGAGTTPHSSSFMPCVLKVAEAVCHSTIAVLPLEKSLRDWFCAYSALPGAMILSLAIRSTYCLTPATAPAEVKSGLPSAVNQSAPCCLARTKTWWMLLDRFEPSAPMPHLPPLEIFFPAATTSSQVAGGFAIPASLNICLL